MKLETWQKLVNKTNSQLAQELKISEAYISLIKSRQRRPGPELADKIEKMTEGAVTLKESLGLI